MSSGEWLEAEIWGRDCCEPDGGGGGGGGGSGGDVEVDGNGGWESGCGGGKREKSSGMIGGVKKGRSSSS